MKNVVLSVWMILAVGCGMAPAPNQNLLEIPTAATPDPVVSPAAVPTHTYRVELTATFNGGTDYLQSLASIISHQALSWTGQVCYPANCAYEQMVYNNMNSETFVIELTTSDAVFIDVGTKNGGSTNTKAKIYIDGVFTAQWVGAGTFTNAEQRYSY